MRLRKILKMIFSFLISIFIFSDLIPAGICVSASEIESEEFLYNGNIYYQINELGEVIITRSRASVTVAELPCEIDGMPVTEIKSNAFQGRTRLVKVVLPETVTKIGDYAFHQCTRLEEVYIPDGVTTVGWSILSGTPWMNNQPEGCIIVGSGIVIGYSGEGEHIAIPEGVTSIAGCAFENMKSLMSVTIPSSVQNIGGLAFSGCTKLTECTIPEGVRTIGAYAFNWCSALQRADIADSVEIIGNHAFLGCSSLISVKLPKNLSRIETAMFCGCLSLTKIAIPASVTEIGSQAFMECISLGEISLRSTVVSIGADAFEGCTGLQRITVFNANCKIADSEKTVAPNAVIYGLRESTAQIYAQCYERQFALAMPLAGDMNEDGIVDISDASKLLSLYAKFSAGSVSQVSAFEMSAGDVNRDNSIDVPDAILILKCYAERSAGIRKEQ